MVPVPEDGADRQADEVAHPAEFVRASRLYDLDRSETVPFDWDKGQTIAASQAEIERAISDVLDGGQVGEN